MFRKPKRTVENNNNVFKSSKTIGLRNNEQFMGSKEETAPWFLTREEHHDSAEMKSRRKVIRCGMYFNESTWYTSGHQDGSFEKVAAQGKLKKKKKKYEAMEMDKII